MIRADNELVRDLYYSRVFTEILRCVQASQPSYRILSTLTVDYSTVFPHPCVESIERRFFDQDTILTQVTSLVLERPHRLPLLLTENQVLITCWFACLHHIQIYILNNKK